MSAASHSLARETLFYSLASWGARLISFAVAPVTVAVLTPDEYGYMSLVLSLGMLAATVGQLAVMDQGLPRFYIDAADAHEKAVYTSSGFVISGLGLLAAAAFVLLGRPLLGLLFDDIPDTGLFAVLLAAYALAQGLFSMGVNLLRWEFRSRTYMALQMLNSLVTAALIITGVIFLGFRAKEIVGVNIAGVGCVGLSSLVLMRGLIRPRLVRRKAIRELLAYSWPLLGLNIFALFTRSLDRVFLGSMGTLADVGIFSVASMAGTFFEGLISGFFLAWGPHMLGTFREPDAPARFAACYGTFSVVGMTALIVAGMWATPVLSLIRPDQAYGSVGVYVPWIIAGILLYYQGGYFSPGPDIAKKPYWKLLAFLASAVTNVALNTLLIPRYGILGACLATTVSCLVAGTINLAVANRMYFIPARWKTSFGMVLLMAAVVSWLNGLERFAAHGLATLGLRLGCTLLLCGLCVVPFVGDMRRSGFVDKAVARLRRRSAAQAASTSDQNGE